MHDNINVCNGKMMLRMSLCALSVMLSGCTLPNGGPRSTAFEAAASDHVGTRVDKRNPGAHERVDYILVDVDSQIMKDLTTHDKFEFAGQFPERSRDAADIRIGAGDSVAITIFEASAGGLFVPKNVTLAGGNFVTLPNQEVDRSGKIKVPYAGRIQAVGRRPDELQREIEEKLSNRAIEPQVVVSIANRASNLVTVLGDVRVAGRFNINLNGYRVLDAIGSAGGNNFQDYETLVTLQRAGRKASIRLSSLTRYPRNNIQIQLGDTIFVQRSQRFFNLHGAIENPGEFVFNRAHMTLANGLAQGKGLIDERADPYSVVLYRLESRKLLEKYGATIPEKYKGRVPTVYRINIRDADGFFFAKHFRLRQHDLVFVANSPWVDALKINGIINNYADTIRGGRGIVEVFKTKIPNVASIID